MKRHLVALGCVLAVLALAVRAAAMPNHVPGPDALSVIPPTGTVACPLFAADIDPREQLRSENPILVLSGCEPPQTDCCTSWCPCEPPQACCDATCVCFCVTGKCPCAPPRPGG